MPTPEAIPSYQTNVKTHRLGKERRGNERASLEMLTAVGLRLVPWRWARERQEGELSGRPVARAAG